MYTDEIKKRYILQTAYYFQGSRISRRDNRSDANNLKLKEKIVLSFYWC